MNKCQQADAAIEAYDAFLFSGFGRPFDGFKADVLASYAADACGLAARDRTVNQLTRDLYAAKRDEFACIAGVLA